MGERISQRGKTLRAFLAYLDLLDTADYMRGYMRGPLETFDLTLRGFRVLEILYREGATSFGVMGEKLQCERANVHILMKRLERRGWVCRQMEEKVPVAVRPTQIAIAKRDKPREGRRVMLLRLTPEGEKLIGHVYPKHAKVVKSLMRALDGREQATLSRLLQKLRKGNIIKFMRELMMADRDKL